MWNKEDGRIRKSSGKKFRDALFPRGQCRMSCSCRRLNRNWINQRRGRDSYLNMENGSSGLQLTGIIVALTITSACNFFETTNPPHFRYRGVSLASGPLHLKFHGIDITFKSVDSSFLTSRTRHFIWISEIVIKGFHSLFSVESYYRNTY